MAKAKRPAKDTGAALAHDSASLAKAMDGRHARSARTRTSIVEAYLGLLREKRALPTIEQIARRAGLSARAVFAHFADRETLAIAAFDHVLAQRKSTDASDKLGADRMTRIRFQVGIRARACETWLPLWQVVVVAMFRSPEIGRRIEMVRALLRLRLSTMYQRELEALAEPERVATLGALEALTGFESWGRMRQHEGLSYETACEAWIYAIDRLLPPTPRRRAEISSTRRQPHIDSPSRE